MQDSELKTKFEVIEKADISYAGCKRMSWRIQTDARISRPVAEEICDKLLAEMEDKFDEHTFWIYFPGSNTDLMADITVER